MTLELRIEPLIKTMIQTMLLNEEDCKEAIEDAVRAAIANFGWREQIVKDVQFTIKREVESMVSGLVHKLLWDEEIHAQFKKAIAKALANG